MAGLERAAGRTREGKDTIGRQVIANEELIQKIPLFASLPGEEVRRLAEILYPAMFPAQTLLFKEGEHGGHFSIILEGEIEMIKAMDTAEQRVLAIMGPGDYFGEMSLLDPGGLRSASARTRTPAHVLEMAEADFAALLARQPGLSLGILRQLVLRLRTFENATIHDLMEKNLELAQAYEDLKTAQAQVIEKEKLEHELEMARGIQRSILPKHVPALPGWHLAAHWQPARAVGGDLYDFFPFPDGRVGIVIADVTGKGVPAALVMATTRSILRATAEQLILPAPVLTQVNDLLVADIPLHMFVTCLYALLDPATGRLQFANAGQTLPFQCNGPSITELRATGMPLGLMPEMEYDEHETTLACGDTLLLYSDGLTEAHNTKREIFGTPRLERDLARRPAGPRADCIRFLLDVLSDFTGPGWEQEDDVTLVTLERLAL